MVSLSIGYTFVFQNPLFLADVNSALSGGPPDLHVSPYLPGGTAVEWSTEGLSFACGGGGPGVLQVVDGGKGSETIDSLILTYGGATYNATGPGCPAGHGTTLISITALGAQPGAQGAPFSGYLVSASGVKYRFTGTWE